MSNNFWKYLKEIIFWEKFTVWSTDFQTFLLMTLFFCGLKWQCHWQEHFQAHGSKRGNHWPRNTIYPAALRQPPCLLFICIAGQPREMLQSQVPAGWPAVDGGEGECGMLAPAEQLSHHGEAWGRWYSRAMFEGTSERAMLGCWWGCCGDFLS